MSNYISESVFKLCFISSLLCVYCIFISTFKIKVATGYEYRDYDNKIYNSSDCYTKTFGSSMYCIDSDGFKTEVSSYRVSQYEYKTIAESYLFKLT